MNWLLYWLLFHYRAELKGWLLTVQACMHSHDSTALIILGRYMQQQTIRQDPIQEEMVQPSVVVNPAQGYLRCERVRSHHFMFVISYALRSHSIQNH